MKTNISDRLSILISLVGGAAFGIGVIAAMIQGGFIAICFAVALLCGSLVLCLDAASSNTKETPHSSIQASH